MADLSQLLSNAADTKADFNFGKLNDAYWAGLEQAYKQRSRDAFQDIDLNSPQGFSQATQRALQVMGPAGAPLAKDLATIDFQRQQIQAGEKYRGPTDLFESGGDLNKFPPSINPTRNANTPVAENLTQGRQSSREPLQPPAASSPPPGGHTVMSYVMASGIPNDQLGAVSDSIARQLGVKPTDKIDTNDPQIRNTLVPAIQQLKKMGIGQTYAPGQPTPPPQVIPPVNSQMAQAGPAVPLPMARPPGAPQPQQQALDFADRFGASFPNQQQPQGAGAPPQAQPAPVQAPPPQVAQAAPPQAPQDISAQSRQPIPIPGPLTAPLTGTQRQAPMSRAEQGVALYTHMLNDPMLGKEQKENAMARLKYFQTLLEPTSPMKEYAQAVAQGFKGTQQEYEDQNRDKAAEIAAKQSVLDKTLPVIVEGRKEALASANSIMATHRAREQLDAPGGVITGEFAQNRTKLLGIAALIGADPTQIINTQTFNSQMSARLLEKVKALPGPASDKDIKFLNGAVGSTQLNEGTLRRMLDINERVDREKIKAHNSMLGEASEASPAIKEFQKVHQVKEPGVYQKPAGAALPKLVPGETTVNGMTYKGGNPKDKNSWEQRT